MQEQEPIVLSKNKESVSSSFCLAPGIIVYTATVLSSRNTNKEESKDTPWPLADIP